LLRALADLDKAGITFDVQYSRGPFFLNGNQQQIEADKAKSGLPPDADNLTVFKAKYPDDWQIRGQFFDRLAAESGLSPRNKDVTDHRISTSTMQAHRLCQYASTERRVVAMAAVTSAAAQSSFTGCNGRALKVHIVSDFC